MRASDCLAMLRPLQWSKNALTLVPVVAAGRWAEAASWRAGACAFVAFSLAASAGYVLNDLKDAPHDALHPSKRQRPIAAGRIPVPVAWLAAALLVAAAIGATWPAGAGLTWVVFAYLAATILYTTMLKQYFLADAITLAALFTLRIVGGCAALELKPSIWLLSVSMFVFFSLALTKRYRELQLASAAPGRPASSRDYSVKDMDLVKILGLCSATVAVLVVALYLESARALSGYREASWLWFACPVIWYWLIRIWSKCDRGELDDDPVLFALRDRGSWVCLGAVAACWAAAIAGVPGIIGP